MTEASLPGVFDPARATQTYVEALSGEARAGSDAYFEGGYLLDALDTGLALAIAFLLLASGASAGLRRWLEARVKRRPLVVWGYAVCYTAAAFLLGLPFAIYRGYFREHTYGLANQTFPAWLGEQLTGLGVSLVLLPLFLVAFYAILRRAPRTWWLGATGLAAFFLGFVILISPVYIAPLFNTYTPMQEGPLKTDILLLAQANGVPADDVYVYDESLQSSRITANVAGLFGTTRIALADTLLERTTPAEVRAVMAHELGHYVLGHVIQLIVLFSVLVLVGLVCVNVAFGWVIARFPRFGVRGIDDVAGLPLISALFALFLFVATPITNSIIRTNEADADNFRLNVAREPDGFASVAMRLSAYRKIEPTPLEEQIFFDHPSGHSRVQMAMVWKAAQLAAGATDLDPTSAPLAAMVAEALAEERAARATPAVAATPDARE